MREIERAQGVVRGGVQESAAEGYGGSCSISGHYYMMAYSRNPAVLTFMGKTATSCSMVMPLASPQMRNTASSACALKATIWYRAIAFPVLLKKSGGKGGGAVGGTRGEGVWTD